MTDITQFDEIRPYTNSEFRGVLEKIVKERGFIRFVKFFFPDVHVRDIINMLLQVETTEQFQKVILQKMVDKIVAKSTTSLTYDGFENIKKDKKYLFITNHRDIILDSVLLNKILMSNGYDTMEVAMGSNLLILKWITDLVKLNKTFIVKRDVASKDLYHYSALLSKYIRFTLTEKKTSVWIAQREGRTKNGDDKTQISLLKMLNISGTNNFVEDFKQLKIVPVCISYEYEPCDVEKVRELYNKKFDKNYKKTRLDDLLSMGKGMEKQKGAVHYGIGKPLDSELDVIKTIKKRSDKFNKLAEIIDNQIYKMYQLKPVNYIAANKLFDTSKFQNHILPADKQNFDKYVNQSMLELEGDENELTRMLMEIYGYPVKNYYANGNK